MAEAKDDRSRDIDARTVFVRGLPLTLTESQLEEAFGDVGPLRRAFTVKDKATSKHRGTGFVQFAVAEDAQRAVELKNGTPLEGRKLKVEIAKRRLPLSERKNKENRKHEDKDAGKDKRKGKKRERSPDTVPSLETPVNEKQIKPEGSKKRKKSDDGQLAATSEKQKPARTIVIGNLEGAQTVETVVALAQKLQTVESVDRQLSEAYINSHDLSRDGCKLPAIAVIFKSVRAAREAIATFHHQKLGESVLWARQLGGEGSKLKKWRLIVRNLSFKVTEDILRETFKHAGFVWEITIPRKEDGQSKGFAFVGYTSKGDAEKAIKDLNGKKIANRIVAVDWALAKKKYDHIVNQPEETSGGSGEEETASESESDIESSRPAVDNSDNDDADEEYEEQKGEELSNEIDLVKKVLDKVVTVPTKETTQAEGSKSEEDEADDSELEEEDAVKLEESEDERPAQKPSDGSIEDGVNERTLFIRNLPVDAKVNYLKEQFAEFGDVSSFRLVLHPLTKKPKGTAFLEYKTREAAEAAIKAAKGAEAGRSKLVIAGKPAILHFAVDRNAARNISTKDQKDHDKRNLHLVKEGYIEPGSVAAYGVSKSDLLKRQRLQTEKALKLRSPNFHVSKTRLAIHNFPSSLTEKDIKEMFIKAVVSRATKQRPVVKQVKLLKNDKESSRGTGFVEFTEHQHALVALRVLNNNPETFGPDKRPIVEFAIENVTKLRKREARLVATRLKSKESGHHQKSSLQANGDDNQVSVKRKRNEEAQTQHDGDEKATKRKKPLKKKETENGTDNGDNKANGKGKQNADSKKKVTKIQLVKTEAGARKQRKAKDEQLVEDEENGKKKRRKRRKTEPEIEDKLDKLMDQYKTKYFSSGTGKTEARTGQRTLENIKRWFE